MVDTVMAAPSAPSLAAMVSCEPRTVIEVHIPWHLQLSLAQAIRDLSQILLLDHRVITAHPGLAQVQQKIESGELHVTVWGRRIRPETLLQKSDRLEITRALRVDPKVARRERFQKQGSRGTGLFALKRNTLK